MLLVTLVSLSFLQYPILLLKLWFRFSVRKLGTETKNLTAVLEAYKSFFMDPRSLSMCRMGSSCPWNLPILKFLLWAFYFWPTRDEAVAMGMEHPSGPIWNFPPIKFFPPSLFLFYSTVCFAFISSMTSSATLHTFTTFYTHIHTNMHASNREKGGRNRTRWPHSRRS